jgi:O-antigen ligase
MKSALKYLLLALAFVPLVVDSSVFFPFITGKSMVIRVIITLVAVLYAGYLFYQESFRAQTANRVRQLLKNPLVISVGAFMGVFFLSTVFAVDKFYAFFGNVERAEGFVGMVYFFGFFILSLLIFERKDWLWFFKLSIIAGYLLFLNEMYQASQGIVRPASFTGNPIYIAAYFLFVMMAAVLVMVAAYRRRTDTGALLAGDIMWSIASALIIPLGLVGIFVSETRGVMVGIVAGLVVVLAYATLRGKDLTIKIGRTFSVRALSGAVLVCVLLFGGIFYATRHHAFWQSVPGFNRLANISATDISTQTRLISLGVSLRAISPSNVGWEKVLVGWGPENFSLAYNHYYNPRYFEFEQQWFDRAHDKLMDVLVMNGVVGFISYMAIWILLAWLLVKNKKFSGEHAALLFFGAAYFVQNLTVFDSIVTYIPLFGFWAFAVMLSAEHLASSGMHATAGSESHGAVRVHESSVTLVLSSLAIFFVIALGYSLFGYYQMRTYIMALQSQDLGVVSQNIDAALYPYSFVQENVRPNFLQTMSNLAGRDQRVAPLLEKSVVAMHELVQRNPYNPRYMLVLAQFYEAAGNAMGDAKYYQLAQEQLDAARALAPDRQDIRDLYAYNLALQGHLAEAYALMEETIALDPLVADPHYFYGVLIVAMHDQPKYATALAEVEKAFSVNGYNPANNDRVKTMYYELLSHFAQKRDAQNLIVTALRLEQLDSTKESDLAQMIGYANHGQWNKITIAVGAFSTSSSSR